jgi:predicted deacylase
MKKNVTLSLPQASPGTRRSLDLIRYGIEGGSPKVYIQAGLHADEAPGFVVAYELEKLLDRAQVNGEIILVPAANPVGLGQWHDDLLRGRHDFSNNINFNREHLYLVKEIAERLDGRLGDSGEENTALIRRTTGEVIAETATDDETGYLKKLLLSLAHDADIVLDLHCDHEALLHVYMGTPLWPEWSDLPAQLGAGVTLLARDSGGSPFDEACSRIWWDLAGRFPDKPIPNGCFSATVELRGIADTDPGTAEKDAGNIFAFLQRRGAVAGSAPLLPPLKNEATPLTAVDYVKARHPGVVSYVKELGDFVKSGEVIAEIIDPLPGDGGEKVHPVRSATDGVLFTRNYDRFARPGRIIAKIAGTKELRSEGTNLLTL